MKKLILTKTSPPKVDDDGALPDLDVLHSTNKILQLSADS